MRWEGSAILRRSPRRPLEAIVTQAVALIVALAGSDLKRSVTKHAQSNASNCRAAATTTSVFHTRVRWQLSRARVAALIKKAAAAK